MDLNYVNKITFIGDVKIIFDTIKVVLKKDGIISETSVTVEELRGEKIRRYECFIPYIIRF